MIVNRTKMPAELYVAADRESRDHICVVIKGTFEVSTADGKARLAPEQVPLKYADEHWGDPATTSIRYESDFPRVKPLTDVLLNGFARAPGGEAVERLDVEVRVGTVGKRVRVVGDRHWRRPWWRLGIRPSRPTPFVAMPLVYERAYGGTDATHENPKRHGTERRNLVGVGHHVNDVGKAILGAPLPNLEDPARPIRRWKDRPPPASFGVVGRGWEPRVSLAGTYDQAWLDDRFPFLPLDFDERYFQSAPPEQTCQHLLGGEEVRCTNVTPEGLWMFKLPVVPLSVIFLFDEHHVERAPVLDTVLLEPEERRVILTWRVSTPVIGKLHDLAQVLVGEPSEMWRRAIKNGKRVFASLQEFMAWRQEVALAE